MNAPRVLILAGGRGTRLASVVSDVPKPLAPIAGRPFLQYQIEFLRAQGFDRFTLLTGHLAAKVEQALGHGKSLDVQIDYSVEREPLGTGGAVRQAVARASEDEFLVLNGDSLFATDYQRFCMLGGGQNFSVALKFHADLSRYGAVQIAHDYQITAFAEKTAAGQDGYINAGAYLLRRETVEQMPAGAFSLENDVLAKLALPALGIPCGGKFVDIGTPESYAWSQAHLPGWLEQTPKPCLFLDRDGVIVEHHNYLFNTADVRLVPQTVEIIRAAKARGWWVSVISNQSGVGRGLFTAEQCTGCNAFIQEQLEVRGAAADLWNCCYDHPREGQGAYLRSSLRRKPDPGMVLESCEQLPIDLGRSLMIGDNETDQLALPDLSTFLVRGEYDFSEVRVDTEICADFDDLFQRASRRLRRL